MEAITPHLAQWSLWEGSEMSAWGRSTCGILQGKGVPREWACALLSTPKGRCPQAPRHLRWCQGELCIFLCGLAEKWSLWHSLSLWVAVCVSRCVCGYMTLFPGYVSGCDPPPPASVDLVPFLCVAVQQPKPKHERPLLLDKHAPGAHSLSG